MRPDLSVGCGLWLQRTLAEQTGISAKKINTWFINARKRRRISGAGSGLAASPQGGDSGGDGGDGADAGEGSAGDLHEIGV